VQLLKEKCDLNKTRAYELIQIADGLTTVEKVRADTNKRKAKHRARPFRNGQPDSDESVAINRLAYRLIQLDIGLARELNRILRQGSAERLADVLDAGIEIEESATNRGGRDPGPIPDFLDRNRVGGMN
jgi:hypothetical protein